MFLCENKRVSVLLFLLFLKKLNKIQIFRSFRSPGTYICCFYLNKRVRWVWILTVSVSNWSLCRCCRCSTLIPSTKSGTTPCTFDDPYDANADHCCFTDISEHHGIHGPRGPLSCWRGREATRAQLTLRTRPGARGRTRGRERHRNRGGESAAPSLLLAVQSGCQLGITAGSSQQR